MFKGSLKDKIVYFNQLPCSSGRWVLGIFSGIHCSQTGDHRVDAAQFGVSCGTDFRVQYNIATGSVEF